MENLHENYNATLIHKKIAKDDLAIFYVKPDKAVPKLESGQFVNIGLYGFEHPETSEKSEKLITKAYSVASSIIPDIDLDDDVLEFYIMKVENGELTPKLFNLDVGDRLYLRPQAFGHYTIPELNGDETVFYASTGTGLAPHTKMLLETLEKLPNGKVVILDCAKYHADLAFYDVLKNIETKVENLIYIPITTRESESKRYVQTFFKEDILEKEYGLNIEKDKTQVMTCGNPKMIGAPRLNRETKEYEFPIENGLVEILMKKYGLTINKKSSPGNIHFEKYW